MRQGERAVPIVVTHVEWAAMLSVAYDPLLVSASVRVAIMAAFTGLR